MTAWPKLQKIETAASSEIYIETTKVSWSPFLALYRNLFLLPYIYILLFPTPFWREFRIQKYMMMMDNGCESTLKSCYTRESIIQ